MEGRLDITGLSMNILHADDRWPMQRGFYKNSGQFIACPKVSEWAV